MAYSFLEILKAAKAHDPATGSLFTRYPPEVVAAAYWVERLNMSAGRGLKLLSAHFENSLGTRVGALEPDFTQLEFVIPDAVYPIDWLYVLDRIGVSKIQVNRGSELFNNTDLPYLSRPVAERLLASDDTLEQFVEQFVPGSGLSVAQRLLASWILFCMRYTKPLTGTYHHGERIFERLSREPISKISSEISLGGPSSFIGLRNLSEPFFRFVLNYFLDASASPPAVRLDASGAITVTASAGVWVIRHLSAERSVRAQSPDAVEKILRTVLRYNPMAVPEDAKQRIFGLVWNTFRIVDSVTAWDSLKLADVLEKFRHLLDKWHVEFRVEDVMLAVRMGESWDRVYNRGSKANVYASLYHVVCHR